MDDETDECPECGSDVETDIYTFDLDEIDGDATIEQGPVVLTVDVFNDVFAHTTDDSSIVRKARIEDENTYMVEIIPEKPTIDVGADEMLVLNELTGRVHRYEGSGLGQPLSCGCDIVDEIVATGLDSLIMIRGRHFEESIWEPAACLVEDE